MAANYKLTPLRKGLNTCVKLWVRLGLPPSRYHLLTVRGRRSGRAHTLPVSIVEEAGERWLVCPYGERQWVKNVREAGSIVLSRGLSKQSLTATEVLDPRVSAPVLKRYHEVEPITRKFFQAKADSSLNDFAAESALHPVFRLSEGR